MLNVFSWGYEGWGNSTRELVRCFDAVEGSRGYGPPLFVDVRVRRQVRAIGFRDDTFQDRVGRDRYRWMPGLGNDAIRTGRGEMRLRSPEDAIELLGLVLAQQKKGRRVVFFCSCGSPDGSGSCHRQRVRKELLAVARQAGRRVIVQEWPGGELASRVREVIRVKPGVLKAVRAGQKAIRLGKALPSVRLLAMPHYSLVRLQSEDESQLVSATPARFSAGVWKLPIGRIPVEAGDTARSLLSPARRARRTDRLEETHSRGTGYP